MTHLIQINLDVAALGKWSGARGMTDNDSATHALVTGIFGRKTLQPYRLIENKHGATLFGYSDQPAEKLSEILEITGSPEIARMMGAGPLSKEMPMLPEGSRIGFEVKVAPVRRKEGLGERDAYDIDVAMGRTRSREESYQNWFSQKIEGIAELEDFRLAGFNKSRTKRKNHQSGKAANVTVPWAILQGTLVIKDATEFRRLLRRGIGRHQSFGYGQLLLRPADPAPL